MMDDEEWMENFKFYTEGILMLIVCIAGLIGNAAAIIVFGKQKQTQKNFYAFMFYLAVFDLIYLIVALLLFVIPQLTTSNIRDGPWNYIVPFAVPIGQISMTGSEYFTAVITIERYLTVCHPFYMVSRNLSARPISLVIVIFAILYNLPKFFEISTAHTLCYYNQTYTQDIRVVTFTSISCEYQYYNQKRWRTFPFELVPDEEPMWNYNYSNTSMLIHTYGIEASDLRFNSVYFQAYTIYSNFFINGMIPFLLIIALNVLIVWELQKTDFASSPETVRERMESCHSIIAPVSPSRANRKRKEIGVAKISLIIAVIFILCHFVKWIPNIHEMIMHIKGRIPTAAKEEENLAAVVISMNLTTNEIISSNSSFVQNENTVTTSTVSSVKEEPEQDYWPNWVRQCMCISHLCLAFNSSVNFYIYYIKRKALNPSQSRSRIEQLLMSTMTGPHETSELITHK